VTTEQQPQEKEYPFDGIDLAMMIAGAIFPVLLPLTVAQYFARRGNWLSKALAQLQGWESLRLLPAPRQQPLEVAPEAGAPVAQEAPSDFAAALAALPPRVKLGALLPLPASTTAVPLGVDAAGAMHWMDLGADALHIGLYGQSGSGKDTLLRLWFGGLARRNDARAVQFAILDGKGDWLTPNLAQLRHMFIAPAGGYGAPGDAKIKAAIQAIDEEARRRQELITAAGCRTREQYQARTGVAMPLLVVVATDVMTSIGLEVEALLEALVSKARALGIRVVVSMQTPTGKSTRWRMNLSTVIAGSLQSGSQDVPALGIPVEQMHYRPSLLPPPQARPGVFVVRRAGGQALVQAPYVPEETFDRWCELLPRRNDSEVLSSLLAETPSSHLVAPDDDCNDAVAAAERDVAPVETVADTTVAPAEAAKIAVLLASLSPSEVVKRLDGYNGRNYREYRAKVDAVARMLEE
jgi:hypothetical protein